MTIRQAIEGIDSIKHNTYTDRQKIAWLSALDGLIKAELMDTHEGENCPFRGYDDKTDRDTELLAYAPFDQMYLHHLESKIDYYNAEYARFNNAMAMFQASYQDFCGHYHRRYRPKGSAIRYF